VAVMIGDVAGHGIASALIAAQIRIEIAMGLEEGVAPARLLAAINGRFHERYGRLRSVTVWLGVFDPTTRRF